MYKILVCGGRKYNNMARMFNYLDTLHQQYGITCLVSGGAPGADALACLWADRRNVPTSIHRANWDKDDEKTAGPIRNQLMIDLHPDISLVVAFPGNEGTKDMIDRALAAGMLIDEVDKR